MVIAMGEATYYLKADECRGKETFEKIKQFILEGIASEEFWQKNRGIYKSSETPLTPKQFWSQFQKKFPIVSKYMVSIEKFGGDFNNEPAGYLNFGSDDDIEHLEFIDDYTDEDGTVVGQIQYSAYVWHFANWKGFAKFLGTEFKLKNVRWVSDEDVNPFDAL
jgi:hypothetical protein